MSIWRQPIVPEPCCSESCVPLFKSSISLRTDLLLGICLHAERRMLAGRHGGVVHP